MVRLSDAPRLGTPSIIALDRRAVTTTERAITRAAYRLFLDHEP